MSWRNEAAEPEREIIETVNAAAGSNKVIIGILQVGIDDLLR
jgi:hypothetical protein